MTSLAQPDSSYKGSTVTYYAQHDDAGAILGVFRKVIDDAAEMLTLQRRESDGLWMDDPSLIDEFREPGVSEITPEEAQGFFGGPLD